MGNVLSDLNQVVQLGQEGTSGTPVSASKRLQSMKITFGDEMDIAKFRPQGRRFTGYTEVEKEWTDFDIAGRALYTEILYAIEMAFGSVSPSTVGTVTKKRVYDVPLTGDITPKTTTMQWGDSTHAYQAPYAHCLDFGMKWDRESGVDVSGMGLAQLKSDTTLTASPTLLALQPILGSHINYYLDAQGGTIGSTQITEEVLDAELEHQGPLHPILGLGSVANQLETAPRQQGRYVRGQDEPCRERDHAGD
jgi:hypothetical protein